MYPGQWIADWMQISLGARSRHVKLFGHVCLAYFACRREARSSPAVTPPSQFSPSSQRPPRSLRAIEETMRDDPEDQMHRPLLAPDEDDLASTKVFPLIHRLKRDTIVCLLSMLTQM